MMVNSIPNNTTISVPATNMSQVAQNLQNRLNQMQFQSTFKWGGGGTRWAGAESWNIPRDTSNQAQTGAWAMAWLYWEWPVSPNIPNIDVQFWQWQPQWTAWTQWISWTSWTQWTWATGWPSWTRWAWSTGWTQWLVWPTYMPDIEWQQTPGDLAEKEKWAWAVGATPVLGGYTSRLGGTPSTPPPSTDYSVPASETNKLSQMTVGDLANGVVNGSITQNALDSLQNANPNLYNSAVSKINEIKKSKQYNSAVSNANSSSDIIANNSPTIPEFTGEGEHPLSTYRNELVNTSWVTDKAKQLARLQLQRQNIDYTLKQDYPGATKWEIEGIKYDMTQGMDWDIQTLSAELNATMSILNQSYSAAKDDLSYLQSASSNWSQASDWTWYRTYNGELQTQWWTTSTDITPSWDLVSMNIGGTTRQFDTTAAPSLQSAFAQMSQSWVTPIVWSGYRSSAEQQKLYDAYLSGKWWLAAKPGTSLHEKWMAIDLYGGKDPKTGRLLPPTANQIAIMNANGWYQTAGYGDKWHFEYKWVQDITTGANDILSAAWLSMIEFDYLTQWTSALSRMSEKSRTQVINSVDNRARSKWVDVSTFRSQYTAINDAIQRSVKIQSNVQRDELEISGTLDNLIQIADEAELMKLRKANIAKIALGKEVNSKMAIKYWFTLSTLREEIAGYYAALGGDNQPDESDSTRAAYVIANGLSSGWLEWLKSAFEMNVKKLAENLPKNISNRNKQVRDLFGVGDKYPTTSVWAQTQSDPFAQYRNM